MSTSEAWGAHYFECPTCRVHESDPEQDVFCPEGEGLRAEAVRDMIPADHAELTEYLTMLADEHAEDEFLRESFSWKPYSTSELLARERRFMDARLP